MKHRLEFQFAATKDPEGVMFLSLLGIDTFCPERFEQSYQIQIHLDVTEIPKLNWERTAEMPQKTHVAANAWKVLVTTPSYGYSSIKRTGIHSRASL